MEQLGDSIHAVSDAMTQLLGTTTLNADKKLDEDGCNSSLPPPERGMLPESALCP